MTTATIVDPTSAPSPFSDGVDARPDRNLIGTIAGFVVAAGLVGYVMTQTARFDFGALRANLPHNPLFWLLIPAPMLVGPVIEWIILRKLWKLPVAGIVPLINKQASNEIVMGYAGDVQFYLWARKNAPLKGSPFATLRDMSVLSALAGNITTLLLMLATYPALRALVSGPLMTVAVAAIGIIVCSSLAIMVAQRRLFVFSMTRRAIFAVFALNIVRIGLTLLFNAMLWAMLVPSISIATIVALSTVRMMLSRVPFVPGKEVVFGGIALFLMADANALAHAVAVVATLVFLVNAVVCAAGGIGGLSRTIVYMRCADIRAG